METGETREDGHDAPSGEVSKVVRIPRDWFGPTEDLVPFGPRALEADTSEGEAGRPQPPPDSAPVDPNSFWDESSSSVQDAVVGPVGSGRRADRAAGGGAAFGRATRVILPSRVYSLWHAMGSRRALACGAIAVVAGISVVGWLLGTAVPRAPRSALAAVSRSRPSLWPRHLADAGASSADRRRPTVRRTRDAARKAGAKAPARASRVVQVVYRSATTASPPPVIAQPGPAAGSSGGDQSSGAPATASAARAQGSTSAFGAGSALGPMSSPDG